MISALTPESLAGDPQPPGFPLEVRKAAMRDIAPILDLINGYAAKGIMLPRTEFELSENIRDFSVVCTGDRLMGCGALHFYSPTIAEIRSVAVDPELKAHGVGRHLIRWLVAEANDFELDAIFAFTYVPGFFAKMGFEVVERGMLPLKAWKDCLRCAKFSCCDEIPVVRILRAEHWRETHEESLRQYPDDGFIQLPTVLGAAT